ncbi:MAG: nuclear transport factor 2 family protein [Polyangiaceae bacterium]
MTRKWALEFAMQWAAAWNARDLDRVLAHFADDIEFTSPRAVEVVGAPTIRGKAALRSYWERALAQVGSLSFTVERVLFDEELREVAIVYTSVIDGRSRRVSENLIFGDGALVTRAEVFHSVLPA